MGIWKVTNCTLCLILVVRVDVNLLQSASGASKFISAVEKTNMKHQSKLGGYMDVKTKVFKWLRSVWRVDDPIYTKHNGIEGDLVLHRLDVLFWKELHRMTDLGSRSSGWLGLSALYFP
eukprot:scaffold49922_cov19-Tisochrysis_lutea.AAC.2